MSEDPPKKPVVLIVMVGEYDDVGISAAFSEDQRELAERHAELTGGEIEEYCLNPVFEDPGQDFWDIWIEVDGRVRASKTPRVAWHGGLHHPYFKADTMGFGSGTLWRGYAENEATAIIEAGKALAQAQQEKERTVQCQSPSES